MIGVFGGTFDPIHFGHLRPAWELAETLSLSEVRFVPARIPPHRTQPVASPKQRLQMVRAALEGVAGFRVDERELGREGPSYMVDTLASLQADLPGERLCLMLGMDAFLGLPSWHQWERLPAMAHLVVAHRPGWTPPTEGPLAALVAGRRAETARDLALQTAGLVMLQPVSQLEISSTGIRALIGSGRSPRFLMPEAVVQWIAAEGLYSPTEAADGAAPPNEE